MRWQTGVRSRARAVIQERMREAGGSAGAPEASCSSILSDSQKRRDQEIRREVVCAVQAMGRPYHTAGMLPSSWSAPACSEQMFFALKTV